MIISRTPFRMSFFGGGTDYPPFFKEHGGSVISTTFNKYCYVSIRHIPKFFEHRNQITYSRIERTKSVAEIEHPMVRNALLHLGMEELSINYDADLPARSGLGSSSSFSVGLLNALHALRGEYVSKHTLVEEAIHVERTLCQESGGWQDQIAVAYGGLNRIDFSGNSFVVRPVLIRQSRKEQLENNLMLFFTGFSRLSSEIAVEQVKSIKDKTAQLLELFQLVDEGERILTDAGCDLDDFGRLLHHTWQIKRGITRKISTDALDEIYARALKNGALGGKLLGAGGGGFFLFYVHRQDRSRLQSALSQLLYVPFSFEGNGSEILYYQPENVEEETVR